MTDLMSILGSQRGELSYDLETGIAYGSVRLAARMAGVDDTSLGRQLQGAVLDATKLGEYLISRGFEGAVADPVRGLPAALIAAICNYYSARAGRWCNETATNSVEMFTLIGLTIAIKSTLGVAVDDRTVIEPPVPQVVIEQPEVTINIGAAGHSHHDYLSDLESHIDEVGRLRERIKKQYNTAEEQEEKAFLLEAIKHRTFAFCAALLKTSEMKDAAVDTIDIGIPTAADPNAAVWAAMNKAVNAPDITHHMRKRLNKYKEIVTYRWNNPATPMPVLAAKFDVSVSNISTACAKFGYYQLTPKPGVRATARTTPTLEV